MRYVGDIFKNDIDFILLAVEAHGDALQHVPPVFQASREVVEHAVQQDGNALEFASDDLKDDEEVVLLAVEQNGGALRHASDSLRGSVYIAKIAVSQDGRAYDYLMDPARTDEGVVWAALKKTGRLRCLSSPNEMFCRHRKVLGRCNRSDTLSHPATQARPFCRQISQACSKGMQRCSWLPPDPPQVLFGG